MQMKKTGLNTRQTAISCLFDLAQQSGVIDQHKHPSGSFDPQDPRLQAQIQLLAGLTGANSESRETVLAEMHQALQIVRQRRTPTAVPTRVVIDSLLKLIRHDGAAAQSLKSYVKWYNNFDRSFPEMPTELDPILDYLAHFDGQTGRTRRNIQDLINRLFEHGVRFCGVPANPLHGVRRPQVRHMPIRTLSLDEAKCLYRTPESTSQRAALDMMLGHGWRQIEVRRILAGDVRRAADGQIWVWGKERNESAPILAETLKTLTHLTPACLADDQPIIRSRRIRQGGTQPLGEKGVHLLVAPLFKKAGLDVRGHDLRRTFATLVRQASKDEFLAMRLIRDQVPDLHDRYISFPVSDLVTALNRYSPIRLVSAKSSAGGDGQDLRKGGQEQRPAGRGVDPQDQKEDGEYVVEAGESRTPRPREAARDLLQA
jgi:integrase